MTETKQPTCNNLVGQGIVGTTLQFCRVPVFDFESVFFVNSIHVYDRTGLEDRVELYRHAESAKHHVSVAVLGTKCLVGDFETWWAVNGAINPGYLQIKGNTKMK